jgi:putative flippase GtrA
MLCIAILFRHKARWGAAKEAVAYLVSVAIMCAIDYGVTLGLMGAWLSPFWSKFWGSITGFVGNFLIRRNLIFQEKKKMRNV